MQYFPRYVIIATRFPDNQGSFRRRSVMALHWPGKRKPLILCILPRCAPRNSKRALPPTLA
jgi:hypothetical protein